MTKYIKDFNPATLFCIILCGLCLLLGGILGGSIGFIWRQQDMIDTLNFQIEEQEKEILALKTTNTTLNREIDDLKELSIDMEKLNEYIEKQEENTELLQKILTP